MRLLYLIFWQVLGLVLLSCRTSSARTSSFSCYATSSPSWAAPTHVRAWIGRKGPCSPRSCGGCPGTALPPLGHPGHDPALASPPRPPTMDLPSADRTTTDRRGAHRPDSADGAGEPALGVPTAPGRAAHARPPGRRLDDPRILKRRRIPPAGTPTPVGGSPAHPGHQHARGRLRRPCRFRTGPPWRDRSVSLLARSSQLASIRRSPVRRFCGSTPILSTCRCRFLRRRW